MNAPQVAGHAVYAPSSAHRWMRCTASATAIAKIGGDGWDLSNGAAEEGTAAHEEIERCLVQLDETWRAKWGETGSVLSVTADHPAAYGVSLLIDYVRQLPPGRLWIEQRVRLTDEIWGRCDVAHWDEAAETLTIVDFKNGFVNVEAEENEQLMIYAAASIYTHNLPAKWIRLVVVQPNSFLPVPRVKQWICGAADLYAFASRAAEIPGGTLTFTAGEHCRYCPMFGQCPASQDVLAQANFVFVNPPDSVHAEQVATFLALKKPIEDWFKTFEKSALKKSLAAGTVPPGMKIVKTQTRRAWKDENEARRVVLEKAGVEALDPPTPAQAEKLGIDVSDLAAAPEGGPALAFESDARSVWTPKTAVTMFAGVASRP